jgi:hypothetical protein
LAGVFCSFSHMTEYSTNLMILLNDYFRIIFKLIVENLVKTEWLIISNPPCSRKGAVVRRAGHLLFNGTT